MREGNTTTVDADLILSQKAFLKMRYYTRFADGEISGIGKTTVDKDGDILVEDIMIFKQVCSGASTELDEGDQAKFLFDLKKNGESPKNWNVWWHSHDNMAVMWSSTDDGTIEDHGSIHTYLISIVTNKKGEYKARLDIFPKDESPFKAQTTARYDLDVKILELPEQTEKKEKLQEIIDKAEEKIEQLDENPTIEKACEKEVEKKVTKRKYITTAVSTYNKQDRGKKPKWGFFDGAEDPFANFQDELVEDSIINEAQKKSIRIFDADGLDKNGYFINGINKDGYYDFEYDEVKL